MPKSRAIFALLPLVIAACVADPNGEFDQYVDRAREIHTGEIAALKCGGSCVAPLPGEMDGEFLFVLSANLAPEKAILFRATIATDEVDEKTQMNWSLQALDRFDRRTPVGDPIVLDPIALAPDGCFSSDLPPLEVTGDANPVSGSPIIADITLSGASCGVRDFYCGNVSGVLIKPIPDYDLAGSTFTLMRFPAPDVFPDPPLIDCTRKPAGPPPEPK